MTYYPFTEKKSDFEAASRNDLQKRSQAEMSRVLCGFLWHCSILTFLIGMDELVGVEWSLFCGSLFFSFQFCTPDASIAMYFTLVPSASFGTLETDMDWEYCGNMFEAGS